MFLPSLSKYKIIITIFQQTGCKKADAWYVQEVDIVNMKSKKTWTFICNQWLSLHHGDGQPCREFFPKQSSKTGEGGARLTNIL